MFSDRSSSRLRFVHKAASFTLAALLLFTSVPYAFAQEITVSTTEAQDTQSIDSAQSSEANESSLQPQGDQVMALSGGSVGQQGGSLYVSDSGILSGAPDVNAQTGAYTYAHPIAIPSGRNDLAPDIALNYNSNNREPNSLFGYGWSVPMQQIYRLNKTGIADLYSSNDFYSELDGELVTSNGTDFVAEFDKGDFRSYEFDGDQWLMFDKAGTRYSFGSTSASQFVDTSSSSRVFAWYLDEIRDTNDNYIKFIYHKDNGRLYPNTVVYTGRGTTDGVYTINFIREARPDTQVSFTPGFVSTTTQRISEIRVDVNGSWVRKYELDYTLGENGNRSLLASITESGNGHGGIVTLPATTFAYSNIATSSQGWSGNNSFTVPERITNSHQGQDMGVRFFDVNGDGYADLTIYQNTNLLAANNVVQKIYLNEGSSWVEDSSWSFPQPVAKIAFTAQDNDGWHDMGARFVDVNADGYTDILWSLNTCFNGWTCQNFRKTYLNNQVDGWIESTTTFALPSDVYFLGGGNSGGGNELADVNGDGLVDIVKSTRFTINGGGLYTYTRKTYLNNGSGWTEAGNEWDSPEVFQDQNNDAGTRLIDFNGDGLIDIVKHTDADYSDPTHNDVPEDTAYLNTGRGWVVAPQWKSPIPFVYKFLNYGKKTKSTRLMDINGDGLTDIFADDKDSLGGNLQKILINTGEGWSDQTSNWTFDPDFYLNYSYSNNGYWITDAGVRFVDFDGDNMVDFVKEGPTDNYPNSPVYINEILTHKGDVPDLLTEVTTSQGGSITSKYTQSARYKKADGKLANDNISTNIDTVSKVTNDNGFGNVYNTTYFYEDGHYFHASTTNRQFAGFGKVVASTDLSTTTTHYHQGNDNSASSSESGDTEAKIGLAYQVEVTDDADNLYSRSRTNWNTVAVGDGEFVKLASQLEQQYDGDLDHKDSATSYTYDNTHGSTLAITEYGEVSGNYDGTFTDSGTDKRTTVYEYTTSTNSVVVPKLERLLDNASTTVRESKFTYDNQSYGLVTSGNLTKREDWVEGSTYIDTEWTYNNYGLTTSQTDPRNNTTSFGYDPYNLFVVSTSNALGHTVLNEYDYSSGQVATTTDQNGEVYVTVYDGLDRPIEKKIPNPQTGSLVTETEYTYTDTSGAVSVRKRSNLDGTTIQNSYTYQNGFGETIQERVEAENSNMYVVRDLVYGDNGLLKKESLPYFSFGTARSTATTDTDLFTTYTYDALKRIVSAQTAVGTTSTHYDQWIETVTDTENNNKDFTYDAFGHLTQVTEHNGVSTYDTTYEWNTNNNLTKITDALSNVRNIEYDGLSRRTLLEDLHDPADNTFGIWTFVYDAAGNVSSTTDPKNQTITHTYDALNRVLSENYTGQTGTEVSYSYDSCIEGVGYLCEVANQSATTAITYAKTGQPASETKTIAGTAYTTEYEYDRQGNQTLVTYPDNSEVQYTYNKGNRIEQVKQRESSGNFADVIEDFDYGPHGLVTYQKHSNGSETTKIYDENELYRLRSILTTGTSTYGTGGPGAEMEEIMLLLDAEETQILSTVATSSTSTVESTDESSIDNAEISSFDEVGVSSTEADVVVDSVIDSNPIPEDSYTVVPESNGATSSASSSKQNGGGNGEIITSSTTEQIVSPQPNDKVQSAPQPLVRKGTSLRSGITTMSLVAGDPGATTTKIIVIQPGPTEGKDTMYGTVYVQNGLPNDTYMNIGGWGDWYYSYIEFDLSSLPASSSKIINSQVQLYQQLDSSYAPNNGKLERITQAWTESGVTKTNNPTTASIGMSWQSVPYTNWWVVDISQLTKDWVDGTYPNYGVKVFGQYNNHAQRKFYTSDETTNTTLRPQLVVEVVNEAPTEPTSLLTSGQTNPIGLSSTSTPYFSALYNDPDGNDQAIYYQVQVDNNSDFSSVVWDSGQMTMATTSGGNRSPDISYDGFPLSASTTYYWRMKFWDEGGAQGVWSTTTATFSLVSPSTSTASLQCTFLGSNTSTADLTTYTYNSQNLGTSSSDRYIVVTTGSRKGGVGGTLNSVTVGGQSATIVGQAANSLANTNITGLAIAAVPAGATGNVVVTWSAPMLRNYIGLYYLKGIASAVPFEVATSTTTDPSVNLDIEAGGCAIGTALSGTASSVIWTGLTEDFDSVLESYVTRTGAHGSFETAQSGLAITANFGASKEQTGTFASWSPAPVGNTEAVLQHLTYTYDSLGNLTKIVDASDTTSATTTYTYDPLSRLTSATTTLASSIPYSRSYTYNPLGNFLTKSDQGTYTYTEVDYANPHAVTTIGGLFFGYDNNGNLTSEGTGTYAWDYRNRLTQSVEGGDTVSYQYDHAGQRVLKNNGTTTTVYPSSLYEVEGATTTKHIYAGDMSVATIEGSGAGALTYHNHLDHLNSTKVVTDGVGSIQSVTDYYPFGDARIEQTYGNTSEDIQYVGTRHDTETDLNLMGARYADTGRGQFISQDPTFLAIGGPDLANKMGLPQSNDKEKRNEGALRAFLSDPQLANSYSYARNNPITLKDPNGNCGPACIIAAIVAGILLDVNTAQAPADSGDLTSSPIANGINLLGLAMPSGAGNNVSKGVIKAGDTISGLVVTTHAAQSFTERNMRPEQVATALKDGVKYLDTKTNNVLHVVGERAKGGYTIVTDQAQETLVSVENFVRNLTPKNSPERFKKPE
ncbi:MAG: DNRLRE domain-containing protein [Patescibacteria group bacterium]